MAESTRNSDKGVSRLNRFSDRSGDNFGCTVPFFRAKFSSSNLNLGLRVPERGGDFSIHIYMLMYRMEAKFREFGENLRFSG